LSCLATAVLLGLGTDCAAGFDPLRRQPGDKMAAIHEKGIRRVLCIGAVHWDSIAHARRGIVADTSTPAAIEQKPGGVATNVARTLGRLGLPVTLTGVIGNDVAGATLRSLLAAEGIDLNLVCRDDATTAQYLALHDPDGGLAAACVDDRILAEAPLHLFDGSLDAEAMSEFQPSLWFADANLPEELLRRVADLAPRDALIADCVSVAKAGRLAAIADRIRLLFANRSEAGSLAGCARDTDTKDVMARLHDLGISEIIITDGAGPVTISDHAGIASFRPAPVSIVDVTGAGDALIAGTLAACARGLDLRKAVLSGLEAASLTIQSAGAVPQDLGKLVRWQAS
jgi:pseudouridine kinase